MEHAFYSLENSLIFQLGPDLAELCRNTIWLPNTNCKGKYRGYIPEMKNMIIDERIETMEQRNLFEEKLTS